MYTLSSFLYILVYPIYNRRAHVNINCNGIDVPSSPVVVVVNYKRYVPNMVRSFLRNNKDIKY